MRDRAVAAADFLIQFAIGRCEEPDWAVVAVVGPMPLIQLRCHWPGMTILASAQTQKHRHVGFYGFPEFLFDFGIIVYGLIVVRGRIVLHGQIILHG